MKKIYFLIILLLLLTLTGCGKKEIEIYTDHEVKVVEILNLDELIEGKLNRRYFIQVENLESVQYFVEIYPSNVDVLLGLERIYPKEKSLIVSSKYLLSAEQIKEMLNQ